jgi:hypothetical protein
MTLREIAASKVTFENIDRLPDGTDHTKKKREIEIEPETVLA